MILELQKVMKIDRMNKIRLSPSLMCMDLCNLEDSVNEISKLDIDMLHIDIIDGYFSPSMPISINMVRGLRKITNIPFDIHLMVKKNDFFIKEFIDIGVQYLCFQYESENHIDLQLNHIRNCGIKAGIALTPATPISVLEYVIEKCDFVLLMIINPGYAENNTEKQVSYAYRKIQDCKSFIDIKGLDVSIEVDGRVSIDSIPYLIEAGADTLVLGNTSLFSGKKNVNENMKQILSVIEINQSRRISK